LAVQINQWNTGRVNASKEKTILAQLHTEFLKNKGQLERVVSFHQASFDAVTEMISLFPIDPITADTSRIAQIMFNAGNTYSFNPSEGSINALISTSSFDLITNETLRLRLIQWNDMALDYREDELDAISFMHDHYVPFMLKHFTFGANIHDPRINYSVMASLELESIFRVRLIGLNDVLNGDDNGLENVRNAIDEIITLTSSEE